ncbi:hypothetical protein NPIL_21601 [Nephila pilipes]|uniref:Uncharacterized protein n=1 Tax=Nephila pilipes TaxID=299642 RepID=A0A8X6Q690_NEPPI|nr:hypothetical protein NPIL_21601 [Nephila pilipes]
MIRYTNSDELLALITVNVAITHSQQTLCPSYFDIWEIQKKQTTCLTFCDPLYQEPNITGVITPREPLPFVKLDLLSMPELFATQSGA